VSLVGDLEQAPLWDRALDGEGPWDELFDGFQSTVDWPGGYFYKELIDVYPDAKVLLSVRDPEAWERSIRDTVWAVRHGDSLIKLLSDAHMLVNPQWNAFIGMIDRLVWGATFGDEDSPEQLIDRMIRHNEEVKATVPADRLLVWEASDGWAPLCEFLELPVPNTPFPHLNDSKEFSNRVIDGAILSLRQWREQESPVPELT